MTSLGQCASRATRLIATVAVQTNATPTAGQRAARVCRYGHSATTQAIAVHAAQVV